MRHADNTAADAVVRMGGSLVQHGRLSDRVYLMKLGRADYPAIIPRMEALAKQEGYSKIFAKVPAWAAEGFARAGYDTEALVPGFFGKEDARFMCRYEDRARKPEPHPETVKAVLDAARSKRADAAPAGLAYPGLTLRRMSRDDAGEMSALYAEVFDTYPFPITDPRFIEKSMEEGTVFMGVEGGGRVVALASAEMDKDAGAAEMTDFATVPALRGRGLASALLAGLEKEARAGGATTAFTIARSYSFGMNITFARAGYEFGGTLANNTNISGSIESMNVWHKSLGGLTSGLAGKDGDGPGG